MLLSQSELVKRVLAGEVVCFPTDTVPAVASLPQHAAKIYRLKRRSPDKPLILMGADIPSLKPFIEGWLPEWERVAETAWPGALTLILPATSHVPVAGISGGRTVGIRIPALTEACQFLAQAGPLFTTSANYSGMPPLVTLQDIAQMFPNLPVLDTQYPPKQSPSTVIRWNSDGQWQLLRQGSYPFPPE